MAEQHIAYFENEVDPKALGKLVLLAMEQDGVTEEDGRTKIKIVFEKI